VAKKTLIIDGGDRKHFLLSVDNGTFRLADGPSHGGVMRGLKVVRFHCEVEFEDDRDLIQIDETGVLHPRAFRVGTTLQIGRSQVSLVATEPGAAPTAVAEPAPEATSDSGPRRLKVVDGGDLGQSFPLPETGTVTVGKPGGTRPGYVDRPYTMDDLEATLADVVGDRAFAKDFFSRYIRGRDAPDYPRLLLPAGFVVQSTAPPSVAVLPIERTGGTLTGAQRRFREQWLGPR